MLGNGVVGILSESGSKWERRAPLAPTHCAKLLHGGRENGVSRIIVQPSSKRIYHDAMYEDVGCEISDDLSQCGLIVGVKQAKDILSGRAYAFFSHTHKAQPENMPLLDKILEKRVTLFDYELIVDDDGKRMLAFGKYAGRAGMIDFLHGLGGRYLSLGYSTPFLSLGASYMYPSLAAAKAAVISVGEEIATSGLPSGICPLVFIFTGKGNVSKGAQEIFNLLPRAYVDPSRLCDLVTEAGIRNQLQKNSKRMHQVYGCVVTCQDMVEPIDPSRKFDKADYYAHPEHYKPVFHKKIAPYASAIVNCMYWEKRFLRLLSLQQMQELHSNGCPLVGVADITCDIGGSIEFVNQSTTIDSPFLRYNPRSNCYFNDMDGDGVIFSSVDILPTEFAKEASQHFGDILYQFIGTLSSEKDITKLPAHLRRSCVAHGGALMPLFEYIPRMRKTEPNGVNGSVSISRKFNVLVSLSGHLFDHFLINEALDIIEAAGGSFHLVKCQVGQSGDAMSYSELQIEADDKAVLDQIIDSLTSLGNRDEALRPVEREPSRILLKLERAGDGDAQHNGTSKRKVLVIGAGRVCQPAVRFLAAVGNSSIDGIHVIVASLFLQDAEEAVRGFPNAAATQLDVSDREKLYEYVSQAEVVISLLPAAFHVAVAKACIELEKHLVTTSYIDDSLLMLDEKAKSAKITILGEMGLDPGIDHMMAKKIIDQLHSQNGKIVSFKSYCGGLPSPPDANNPLAYKFSWSPAGAIRAGRNPATYRSQGEIIHVEGNSLYDSAERFRLPHLPAFALECLPNRNSLTYENLYSLQNEALTMFRGTLRYEGFSNIMGTLARIGLLNTELHLRLQDSSRKTYKSWLCDILELPCQARHDVTEEQIAERIIALRHCKDPSVAAKTAKTIRLLGLHDDEHIPAHCRSPFDATCFRMEERMAYSCNEHDMVLLHLEVDVRFPDACLTQRRSSTLVQFGTNQTTAMSLTVGATAAIGALLILDSKIRSTGVIRPLEPEVYIPALEMLEAQGIRLVDKVE